MTRPVITELASSETLGTHFGQSDEPASDGEQFIPPACRRRRPPALPHLDEPTLREHFADAARLPRPAWTGAAAAERAASLRGLVRFHPRQPAETVQGLLEMAHGVARTLAKLTGLDRFTLQPPTLAAAERAALLLTRATFVGTEPARKEFVAPCDSPALAAAERLGFSPRPVPRRPHGDVDLDALSAAVGSSTAAVVVGWLTPSGAFERHLAPAAEVAHAHGALCCVDARGLGALVGRTRLREAGADVAWLALGELCPTATSAALGVRSPLTPQLPGPLVGRTRGGFELDDELDRTIGQLSLPPGNALDVLALYVKLALLGEPGLRARAERLALEASALAAARPDEYPEGSRRPLAPPAAPRGPS